MTCALEKRRLAEQYFLDGYNCAQAVALAFEKELGIDKEVLIKISSSFGGGFGRQREICGAVSAMGIVAGLLKGCDFSASESEAKAKHYALVQKLSNQFKDINGSIICRDLLGAKLAATNPQPDARTPEYYKKRPCAKLVGDMAEILANEFCN